MFPFYKTFACIAVGVLALAAVEAGQVHEQILDELERRLDEQFVGEIDARRLTGTLLWGFTAHDVVVRDSKGQPVAHIEEFQVEASVFDLLDGDFRFDHARFVRPIVLVERDADGRKNVEEVFRSRGPDDDSRPAGKVLFEMSRAQIVDGQLFDVDPKGPAPSAALLYSGANSSVEPAAVRVMSARAINAEGHFRVVSGKKIRTTIDWLDAEIFPVGALSPSDQPHQLSVKHAQINSDAGACHLSADTLTVDDHWRVDELAVSEPGRYSADAERIAFRARASSPDGGWLKVDGRVDREDTSYDLAMQARDFKPVDWPGAPGWSWFVLDGAGSVTGRGWTREEADATVRWNAADVDIAGERLQDLRLVARVADQRVEVDRLDITAGDFSTSATGHVAESGGFALEIDTELDGAFAKRLANKLGAHKISAQLRDVARLELSTRASGSLDLAALDSAATNKQGRDGLQVLEQLEADTTWKARDVILDDMRFDVAGGSWRLKVPKTPRRERTRRNFSYTASAALHDLHHRALGADILRASIGGDGVWDGDGGLEGLSYRLEIDGNAVTSGEHRTKRARLVLEGALSPADGNNTGDNAEGNPWPLETLAARGKLDLFDYRHDKVTARRVATNIDVSGAFPVGKGTIVAHMTGLRANDRRFRHAKMVLRLLDGQRFRLESKARVEISLIPDLPMYLDVSGRHARDLKALTLDKFTIGRPGMRWRIRKPGLVLFEDGVVALKSLALHRRSQRVRLDGNYGEGTNDSISDLCSRLASAQLRSFFDFSSLF